MQSAYDAAPKRPGTVRPKLAAETLRLYAGDWAGFQGYCAEHGHSALPAGAEAVAAYLLASHCGRTALTRRLAAIDHYHRQRGLPLPGADASLRATLRLVRQTATTRARTPAPSADALGRMARHCCGDLVGQRDRALLLLLAAGLGRRAVVELQAETLRFTEAGLSLHPGRNDDSGPPKIIPRREQTAACPVRAVEEWLRLSATRYGPVFRKVNRWGQLEHTGLGADAIRLVLTRRAIR